MEIRHIFVSMLLDEKVLGSYLIRVFGGELIVKKSCKVVHFPEIRLYEKGWSKEQFISFCTMAPSKGEKVRIYKAKSKTNYIKNGTVVPKMIQSDATGRRRPNLSSRAGATEASAANGTEQPYRNVKDQILPWEEQT